MGRTTSGKLQKTLDLTAPFFKFQGSITCPATTWTTIGSYVVPHGAKMRFGYGASGNQATNIGTIYGTLKSAGIGTTADGQIRLEVWDTQDRIINYGDAQSVATQKLRVSETDRTQMYILAEQGPMAMEDQKLIVRFYNPTAAQIILDGTDAGVAANGSGLRIDTTYITVR